LGMLACENAKLRGPPDPEIGGVGRRYRSHWREHAPARPRLRLALPVQIPPQAHIGYLSENRLRCAYDLVSTGAGDLDPTWR
jgi:hypothetical protein